MRGLATQVHPGLVANPGDFMGKGSKPDGNRWNDCHYTGKVKQQAREARESTS